VIAAPPFGHSHFSSAGQRWPQITATQAATRRSLRRGSCWLQVFTFGVGKSGFSMNQKCFLSHSCKHPILGILVFVISDWNAMIIGTVLGLKEFFLNIRFCVLFLGAWVSWLPDLPYHTWTFLIFFSYAVGPSLDSAPFCRCFTGQTDPPPLQAAPRPHGPTAPGHGEDQLGRSTPFAAQIGGQAWCGDLEFPGGALIWKLWWIGKGNNTYMVR